jgi:hypothetical protein
MVLISATIHCKNLLQNTYIHAVEPQYKADVWGHHYPHYKLGMLEVKLMFIYF